MNDIRSMYLSELKDWTLEIGEPSYRAGQIFDWLHHRLVCDPAQMSNIPASLRSRIGELHPASICDVRQSSDGTRKYLFEMEDHSYIESVLMKYSYGNSVCVSSQVGCRMGCSFCASTLGGLVRNLEAWEILEQIYQIALDIDERISHIVVMGCGEPFDNYDNLVRFIRLITDPAGYGLSRRNITVSTCGLPDEIRAFAELDTGVTLAISLHAPTDELRKSIMPIANKYSISDVINAAEYYFTRTGRRVTLEYALIGGTNDGDVCARELAAIASGIRAHVNLIPVNPVTERGYAQPSRAGIAAFKNKLENAGINVTIRRELGQDIDGACGQLRMRYMEDKRD